MRRLFFLVSAALIAWALAVVQLPLAVLAPSSPTPADTAIETTGHVSELTGEVFITTVGVLPSVSSFDALLALFDEHSDVTLRVFVVPPDVDEEELFEQQRQLFRESGRVAAAVGLERAGQEVVVTGDGVLVRRVLDGAPAGDVLGEDDVIVAVDGEAVGLASELVAITTESAVGDTLTLTVVRDDEEITVDVTLGVIPGSDQVGLGILVQTLNQRIEYPPGIDVEIVEQRIGGPSGGLMIALLVYDLFSEEDLLRGRVVAGTGTVDSQGVVGQVGGIDKKVVGAAAVGAEIFLAPTALADTAREAAPGGLVVIAVETVDDAIEALRDVDGS